MMCCDNKLSTLTQSNTNIFRIRNFRRNLPKIRWPCPILYAYQRSLLCLLTMTIAKIHCYINGSVVRGPWIFRRLLWDYLYMRLYIWEEHCNRMGFY